MRDILGMIGAVVNAVAPVFALWHFYRASGSRLFGPDKMVHPYEWQRRIASGLFWLVIAACAAGGAAS